MATFNDIHGVEGLIIAVGDSSRIEMCTDGKLWRRHRPAIPSADLTKVRVLSPSLAFITGSRGLILRWDGKDFHPLHRPTPRNLFTLWGPTPRDAASAPPEVWFGGADILLHLRGDRFLSYPIDHWVTAIWGFPQPGPFAADVWFVGPTRRCLRWDGIEMYAYHITPPDSRAAECLLHGISGTGPDEVWLAGSQGLILRHTTLGWERVPSGTTDALYGICHAPASGEAWVASGSGQVRRYRGNRLWSIQADLSALGGGLAALCIVGRTVWFCGRKGIFHYHLGEEENGSEQPGLGPR